MNSIKVNKKELLTCLEYVISACASATINPILSQILCQIKKNRLTLIATNHEIQITAHCKCQAENEFSQTLPASKLQTILRALEGDVEVELNFDTDTATLKAKRSVFKLQTLVDPQFVLLGAQVGQQLKSIGKISSDDLLLGLKKVSYASAKESHRMYLNGILIEQVGDELKFIATDGHRLALKSLPFKSEGSVKHILPRRTVDILIQRLKEGEKITIKASDKAIQFTSPDFELISNIIDENFPDYQSVIPRNNENQASINQKDFQFALRRALAVSDRNAVVSLELEKNQMQMECSNQDSDKLQETLDIKYEGPLVKIIFNTLFLADVFNAIEAEQVLLEVSDEKSATLIRLQDDDSFLYVVMPIRV